MVLNNKRRKQTKAAKYIVNPDQQYCPHQVKNLPWKLRGTSWLYHKPGFLKVSETKQFQCIWSIGKVSIILHQVCKKEWIKEFCTVPWHLTCLCQKQKYLYSQPLCSPERKNISDIVWPSQMQKLRNRSQEISYAENFLKLFRSNWQLDQGKHFRISMG